MKQITRIDFLKKLIRLGLLALLALIVLALGNRIVSAKDCSKCLVSGSCTDEKDCYKN
jgi:hypothetical protein